MAGRERLLSLLNRFGADAVSFQALESGMQHWFEVSASGEALACVAYVDTGRVWVGAGRPLTEPGRVGATAAAFVGAAKEHGRSACFFASEFCDIEGFRSLLLGQQPVWRPSQWRGTLERHRRIREQLRRAAAKGVRVRRVPPTEFDPGRPLRFCVESLADEWMASRHMEPMAFLVALEPFQLASEHRYYIAECDGIVVGLLSAVPIYARCGWLIEDIVRSRRAPNGTTEVLIDAMMREAASDSEMVTLGLAPLSGPVAPLLRLVRTLTLPLYDFGGILAFKRRLQPSEWQNVWLVFPQSEAPLLHIVASLRAFANGSLFHFALRSIVRHPSGPPWALALPLMPWTLTLAGLVASGRSEVLGFTRGALLAWVAFDALLAFVLMRTARRPRRNRLAYSTAAAAADAVSSVIHLLATGLGGTFLRGALRIVAALAPCVGTTVLGWATSQATARSVS